MTPYEANPKQEYAMENKEKEVQEIKQRLADLERMRKLIEAFMKYYPKPTVH